MEAFEEILESWGFHGRPEDTRMLFDWLDYDRDEKITFLDLKQAIGFELVP